MHNAHDIEKYYKSALEHPFPYKDCRWVALHTQIKVEDLIPNFDWYDSNVAGYASSATKLEERSPQQLQQGLHSLQKDFLSTFPDLAACRDSMYTGKYTSASSTSRSLRNDAVALLPLFEKLTFATKGQK
jgi:hypothetical protein